MEHGLPLATSAGDVSPLAIADDLDDVTLDCEPSLDLPLVFSGHPASAVVPAVPLEPTSRIRGMDPSFLAPDGERLARVDAEAVKRGIVPLGTELGARVPVGREFLPAIRHVLPAEDPEREHFFRREIGREARIEVLPLGFRQEIDVSLLHLVVDGDLHGSHLGQSTGVPRPSAPLLPAVHSPRDLFSFHSLPTWRNW